MKKNHLLTEDISKLIKQIAIPSSVGMFFNTMYNVVDTFYVGMISTIAITALSYSFVVFFLLLSLSFGLSSAITAHVGNSFGRDKIKLAQIYIANGLSFVMFVSFSLLLIGFIFLEDIFVLMGAKDEALVLALEYTYVILIGVVPMLLGLGANAVLIARGDTKSYRNTLIAGFFLNLLLNPLFIYGYGIIPAFGFSGVAYATLFTQIVTFVYIFYKLYQTNLLDLNRLKWFLPNKRIYKQIAVQAIPQSLNMFIMSLGTMVLMAFVSQYDFKAVAAFGIGYRVEQIILLPMLGLNIAVSAIVANNYGAKNFERINEVIRKSLFYGYIMSGIGVILLAVFGKYLIMIFDNDMEVVNVAYGYVLVESFVFFAYITIFISNSVLQGIKHPFIIPYISFYRQILMPIMVLYFLVEVFFVDIVFVWIAMALIIYSAAIYIFYYTKKKLSELTIEGKSSKSILI